MAYIVLAAGAVMVLIGTLAIVTGYPIIQVERGWTTVIAGTSLLAGGIVTMALSLVLRALMDLRTALVTPEVGVEHGIDGHGIGGHGVGGHGVGGHGIGGHEIARQTDRAVEPPFESRTEPATPVATSWSRGAALLGATAIAVPAAALVVHEAGEPHDVDTQAIEATAHDHDMRADHASPAATVSETHSDTSAHDESLHEASAPRLDDWLDRAFADLHEPANPVRAEPSAAAPAAQKTPSVTQPSFDHPAHFADPIVEHAPATQLHDDHVETHADAYDRHRAEAPQDAYADAMGHAEPAPADYASAPPTAAVIGRYEADGTSYTMYADGSIDAQSNAGVYRFSSMAELKAFIEG